VSGSSPFNFVRRLFAQQEKQPPANDYEQVLRKLEALDYSLQSLASKVLAGPAPQPVERVDGQVGERLEAVQQRLAAVEKQLQRSGREQLKANALVEAQHEQAQGALELLGAESARRDEELERLRSQLSSAQETARLEVVRQLLPALDGIEEALRAGEQVLGQQVAAQRQPTLFERMRARTATPAPEDVRLREALRSWLHGLTFVRQRLLDVLASERVRPIEALHSPFDPTLHIALQAVPATPNDPPGTVAAVLRGGYTVGERVLRHAEVAVAQERERTAP